MRSAENRSDGAIAKLNTLSALEARGVRPSRWLSKQVLVPGPEGKPVPRAVQVGLENDQDIEITGGLQPGDTVLIISRRYVTQQAASNSPLLYGGSHKSGGGQAGGRSGSKS